MGFLGSALLDLLGCHLCPLLCNLASALLLLAPWDYLLSVGIGCVDL